MNSHARKRHASYPRLRRANGRALQDLRARPRAERPRGGTPPAFPARRNLNISVVFSSLSWTPQRRAPAEASQTSARRSPRGGRIEDGFTPILYVTDDHTPAARLACFEAGADAYLLRPFAPEELLAQARALLRIKDVHDRLNEKTTEIHRINKRLQQARHKQIDQELELASRIQSSFLPQTLPETPGSRFAVHYQLCGRVGGDFYDVFRLDENHVGFYVAGMRWATASPPAC